MKIIKFFFFIFLISIFSVHAVEVKFIGPCEADYIMKTSMPDEFTNVGEATVAALTKFSIPFTGSAKDIASAFGTPVGDASVEVISDIEMRAYGWCFEVDGMAPEVYPNEVNLNGVKTITWWFGYASYLNGEWVTQCSPSWKIRPPFMCEHKRPTNIISL